MDWLECRRNPDDQNSHSLTWWPRNNGPMISLMIPWSNRQQGPDSPQGLQMTKECGHTATSARGRSSPHQEAYAFYCLGPGHRKGQTKTPITVCQICEGVWWTQGWKATSLMTIWPCHKAQGHLHSEGSQCCTHSPCHSPHHGTLFPFHPFAFTFLHSPDGCSHSVQARLCHKCYRHIIGLGLYHLSLTSLP